MNAIVKNINGLQISTMGQFPKLTKGQSALLKLIRECTEKHRHLTFDLIVECYYWNVRKTFSVGIGWHYPAGASYGRYREYEVYDILKCWKNQEKVYKFKAPIRQWFVANVGILAVKNQLVVIPIIDLGENEKH